jgi:hypothetical protein
MAFPAFSVLLANGTVRPRWSAHDVRLKVVAEKI